MRTRKIAIAALKAAFAFGALGYVLSQTGVEEIAAYVKQADIPLLLVAFIMLNIAIIIGALRLGIYMRAEGMQIGRAPLLKIFYAGMFFNTVLPGGIGGDGYIALHLKREAGLPATSIFRLLLAARANGLFFLNIYFFIFLLLSDYADIITELKLLVAVLFILQWPVYMAAARIILRESLVTFVKAGVLSFLSQGFFIIAAWLVFTSLGVVDKLVDYMSLFIASAVAAVLPISPGGVGIRELIFYHGSELAGLNADFAVAASLVYFGIYLCVSLTGLVFYLRGFKIAPENKSK